jgi:hypothetical protein
MDIDGESPMSFLNKKIADFGSLPDLEKLKG